MIAASTRRWSPRCVLAVGCATLLAVASGCDVEVPVDGTAAEPSATGADAAVALPRSRPLAPTEFEPTADRRERGRYVAEAVGRCLLCHSPRDWTKHGGPPLEGMTGAGAVWGESEGYRMVAPNLTPDLETGTGSWSDDMLARAIREGIGHDGRALNPAMPYGSFQRMSDEDVASVVVYLRSLTPIRNPLPARLVSDERQRGYDEAPVPITSPVPGPDPDDPIARAAYLMGIADCSGCHTNWYGDQNPGIWAGGNWIDTGQLPPDEHAFSLNLTPSPSGIPYYDESLFVRAMRTGYVVARRLRASMPWRSYAAMSDEDLALIFAALQTLPPLDHVVDNEQPPSMCSICGSEHGGGDRNRARVTDEIALPDALLAELAGQYRFDDGTTIELRVVDARLDSELTGPLYAREDGWFETHFWGAPIYFERDALGRVVGLVSVELQPWRADRLDN